MDVNVCLQIVLSRHGEKNKQIIWHFERGRKKKEKTRWRV